MFGVAFLGSIASIASLLQIDFTNALAIPSVAALAIIMLVIYRRYIGVLYKSRGVRKALLQIHLMAEEARSIVSPEFFNWPLESNSDEEGSLSNPRNNEAFLALSDWIETALQKIPESKRGTTEAKQLLENLKDAVSPQHSEQDPKTANTVSEYHPSPVITAFNGYFQKMAAIVYEIMISLGYKIDRVTIKVCCGTKTLYTVGKKNEKDSYQFITTVTSEDAEENPFWRLFRRVSANYESCQEELETTEDDNNPNLQAKPSFLAFDYIPNNPDPNPPETLRSVIDVLNRKGARELDDSKTTWNKIIDRVRTRYSSCLGIVIQGDPKFDLNKPDCHRTKQGIGFIGIDSRKPGVFDHLDPEHLNALAAIADGAFATLQLGEQELLEHFNNIENKPVFQNKTL
ncbi:MAG: hypothetical protein AAF514_13085 [Verrucomicrobiota bacterium]